MDLLALVREARKLPLSGDPHVRAAVALRQAVLDGATLAEVVEDVVAAAAEVQDLRVREPLVDGILVHLAREAPDRAGLLGEPLAQAALSRFVALNDAGIELRPLLPWVMGQLGGPYDGAAKYALARWGIEGERMQHLLDQVPLDYVMKVCVEVGLWNRRDLRPALPRVVEALGAERVEVRRDALFAMRLILEANDAGALVSAVDALVGASQDPDPDVRERATTLLTRIVAETGLGRGLPDGGVEQRVGIVNGLGATLIQGRGDAAALGAALERLLLDLAPQVRARAAEVLEKAERGGLLGACDPDVLSLLVVALDDAERGAAIGEHLSRLVDRSPGAAAIFRPLVGGATGGRRAELARRIATGERTCATCRFLPRYLNRGHRSDLPPELGRLTPTLRIDGGREQATCEACGRRYVFEHQYEPDVVSARESYELWRLPDEALDPARRFAELDHLEEWVRRDAAWNLAARGDEGTIRALLAHEDPAVRLEALAAVPNPLPNGWLPLIEAACADPEPSVRAAAAAHVGRALVAAGGADLVGRLACDDAVVLASLVDALRAAPEPLRIDLADRLSELVHHPDEAVALAAAGALEHAARGLDSGGIDRLFGALPIASDRLSWRVLALLEGAAAAGRYGAERLPDLEAALSRPHQVGGVIRILAPLVRCGVDVGPLLGSVAAAAADSNHWHVVGVLGLAADVSPRAIEALSALLPTRHGVSASAEIYRLVQAGQDPAPIRASLEAAARESHRYVVEQSVRCLVRLALREGDDASLLALLEDERAAGVAASELGELPRGTVSIGPLRPVLERLAALGDDDWYVRGGALRALTRHG